MADGSNALGDFFAKKKKKAIKGSNLNNEASKPSAGEEKVKSATKDKEEEGWEEEQVAAHTMKVEVAGKLTREDEKKEEEDTVAPAWRATKASDARNDLSDKKYPTLAKAVGQSSNINMDDGSEPKVNIKTTKNAFAALKDEDDDDDEDGPRRPKEIKPAMVQKQKGEREAAAIQREVDKFGGQKKEEPAKAKKAKKKRDRDDDDEDDEEEQDKKKKDEKKGKPVEAEPELDDEEKIEPDLEASRAKYKGRAKLPKKELPASELEEEKENRPQVQQAGGKKGKKKIFEDEDTKPRKLEVADWD